MSKKLCGFKDEMDDNIFLASHFIQNNTLNLVLRFKDKIEITVLISEKMLDEIIKQKKQGIRKKKKFLPKAMKGRTERSGISGNRLGRRMMVNTLRQEGVLCPEVLVFFYSLLGRSRRNICRVLLLSKSLYHSLLHHTIFHLFQRHNNVHR